MLWSILRFGGRFYFDRGYFWLGIRLGLFIYYLYGLLSYCVGFLLIVVFENF